MSMSNSTYTLLKVISNGSYGMVYTGRDNRTGEIVAIKHEFHGMSQSTVREYGILSCLPPHPSIVEFKELIKEKDGRVYIVMEYLEMDLIKFMRSRTEPLTLTEVKFMVKKILEGVDYLHDFDVMHRDLKPENILMSNQAGLRLKICDFGLSRIFERESGSFTPGVCTLWYRAPEILMGVGKYTQAVDMWSIGCIMAELMTKEALFPGESELEQISLIRKTPGHVIRRKLCEAASFRRAPLLTACGYDLLLGLLSIDPEKRITAKDALYHNWFNE